MTNFYLTTSIPYVNADPHIGFAMELLQGDAIARWSRLTGRPTRFVTGSDENALKNVQAAEKANMDVLDFVTEKAERFHELSRVLGISADDFIRTTEDRHMSGAQKLWTSFKSEDIYRREYQGLYCVGCESFKTDKELVNGLCPIHGTPPELITENNYFFRLSAYQNQLQKLIESGDLEVIPGFRKNEILQFLKEGLEDISISRSQERAKNWGIPVPGDPDQVMYVWVDALSNYINALGFGEEDNSLFREWWESAETMHIVGKDITRFHAIYWPAFLLSAGIKPPTRLLVHGFITTDGQKMSKTLGNVTDPFALIAKYGIDPLRFYLLSQIPTHDDGDYSLERFEGAYEANLANDLGNLLQRVLVMTTNYNAGKVPDWHAEIPALDTAEVWNKYMHAMGDFKLDGALSAVWSLLKSMNQKVNEYEPWKTVKVEPDKASGSLRVMLEGLAHVSIMLEPFLPTTADNIRRQLNFELPAVITPEVLHDPLLVDGTIVGTPTPLFPKLEVAE